MASGAEARLIEDVTDGLWQHPPTLPARWFYDERGSRLFDEITRLPEYYPTRRESEILEAHRDDIVALTKATTLIELGSGTSTKTRLLLDAFTEGGRELTFVPLDVSAEVLAEAAQLLIADYPTVTVVAQVADFTEPFGPLPGAPGERLAIFLGGTIGNFDVAERDAFLGRIRAALAPGDAFLLGADLVKPPERLVAAYDDAAGVTAAFNRNLIEVLRRDLCAEGLYVDDFAHVARWNAEGSRIEMWLRAVRDVHAHFGVLERDWDLAAGTEIRTEISVKFRLDALRAELERHGLHPIESWTDTDGDFSLTLSRAW